MKKPTMKDEKVCQKNLWYIRRYSLSASDTLT